MRLSQAIRFRVYGPFMAMDVGGLMGACKPNPNLLTIPDTKTGEKPGVSGARVPGNGRRGGGLGSKHYRPPREPLAPALGSDLDGLRVRFPVSGGVIVAQPAVRYQLATHWS